MRLESVLRGSSLSWVGVLLLAAGIMGTGCSSSSSPASSGPGTEVVVFVDLSDSTQKKDRELYKRTIVEEILPTLTAGDRLLVAPINDKTLTEFRPFVDATFPPKPAFNGWLDNTLKYNRQMKQMDDRVAKLKDSIGTEVADALGGRYSSPYTDIFSSLLVTQKLFHNQRKQKVLVLMSDMIEDYPPYRFDHITWKPTTNETLLSDLDAKGLIPDLSGVCVYVSGVSARSPEVAENISSFWQAYFRRTKADMDHSRYAHILLHWPPATSCWS